VPGRALRSGTSHDEGYRIVCFVLHIQLQAVAKRNEQRQRKHKNI